MLCSVGFWVKVSLVRFMMGFIKARSVHQSHTYRPKYTADHKDLVEIARNLFKFSFLDRNLTNLVSSFRQGSE